VLIGKDTRISGYMLESALESGFNSAGVNVVLLGPLPTPGVAYLTRAQRASLGVVISASHNPFADNGIKFFSAQGNKLSDTWELAVEAALEEAPVWVDSANLGKTKRLDDAAGRYIEFCKSTFSNDLTLKGLKIVVDAAHGAAYHIAPKVFHELGADVIAIGCSPDGLNINHEVGATHPDALVRAVKANHADFGIALDGDADRLANDEVVSGVVGTLMTNMAVEVALKKRGVQFVRAKVGDRYVLEELAKHKWILGGEGSGHLLALDKHTTGDGLVSALQILQTCVRSGKAMAELLKDVTLFPQTLINVRLRPGQDWQSNTRMKEEVQKAEVELGDTGRVLIRASGTEPLVRVMVEARDEAQANACAKRIADTLSA